MAIFQVLGEDYQRQASSGSRSSGSSGSHRNSFRQTSNGAASQDILREIMMETSSYNPTDPEIWDKLPFAMQQSIREQDKNTVRIQDEREKAARMDPKSVEAPMAPPPTESIQTPQVSPPASLEGIETQRLQVPEAVDQFLEN